MTPQTDNSFYTNEVLVEELDYTVVENPQPLRPGSDRVTVTSKILRAAATIAATGTIVFGPCGVTAPAEYASGQPQATVIVHVHSPQEAPRAHVVDVPIPDPHRLAAERFKRLFSAVPLHEVEKLPDPDFGL